MNTYSIAYSIGYFYGRTYPGRGNEDVNVSLVDIVYLRTAGFKAGFEAGKRDYQIITEGDQETSNWIKSYTGHTG